MAAITTAILAAGTAIGTGLQIMQARNAKEAGKIQAKQIKAEQNNAELETAEAMKRQRIASQRHLSSLRARLAATGTVTTQGTPLAILGENVANIETSFQDAARRSAMQFASMDAAAKNAKWQGNQAYTAGMISAGGTLASGIGQTFNSYSKGVYDGQIKDTFNIYPRR